MDEVIAPRKNAGKMLGFYTETLMDGSRYDFPQHRQHQHILHHHHGDFMTTKADKPAIHM